jgi:rhodanese-related sulfurtransferase
MRMSSVFSFVAVLALLSGPVFAMEGAPEITLENLKAAMADGKVTLVDANGAAKYKEGHIPGALNYAGHANDFAKHLPEDKGALIVAYCGGPQCNAYKAATDAAMKLGYTNVKHYPGGISGWVAAGEKVETGDMHAHAPEGKTCCGACGGDAKKCCGKCSDGAKSCCGKCGGDAKK